MEIKVSTRVMAKQREKTEQEGETGREKRKSVPSEKQKKDCSV